MHGPEIFPLAKLVAVADSFAEKIVAREVHKESISVMDALALMKEDQGHFDKEMLEKFENIFARKIG